MATLRSQMRDMNAYDLHKILINEYILKRPGDTQQFQRDTSKDRNDYDVLRTNHKFLWDEIAPTTWEEQFAKKYYDKLFKEYCISDLTLYKENKIALRWRIEKEVISGKGQFICGNKLCNIEDDLKTWEVNFAYTEMDEKKNALVKIRLCPDCSHKLNYHKKRREVKRLKRSKWKKGADKATDNSDLETQSTSNINVPQSSTSQNEGILKAEISPWDQQTSVQQKSRDEEMEDYFDSLLL